MFDIKDFYPSIQKEVLNKGLRFAQEYIDVTSKDTENITMLKNLYFLMEGTHG